MAIRPLLLLIMSGIISLTGILYFTQAENDPAYSRPAGSNAFSYAATGHKAFVDLLDELDLEVTTSQFNTRQKASPNTVIAMIEPHRNNEAVDITRNILSDGDIMLVVPKWQTTKHYANRLWINTPTLIDGEILNNYLLTVMTGIEIVRVDALAPMHNSIQPEIGRPQLIRPGKSIQPVIQNNDGILVGRISRGGATIWVISDPDILSNHGLRNLNNAIITVGIMEDILGNDKKLVIDETIHGLIRRPTIWTLIFSAPYNVIAVTFVLVCLLILWAAMIRFGAPVPGQKGLEIGKARLIRNTTSLLRQGRHEDLLLQRYFDNARNDVLKALHIPSHIPESEQIRKLDDIARARELHQSLSALYKMMTGQPDHVETGKAIYQWKMEMLYGSGRHQ